MRHKYSLIRKTETLTLDELLDIAKHTLFWLENNLGVNKRHKIRQSLSITNDSSAFMGLYEPYKNKMTIYVKNNEYIRDFVQTIIHEYTHTLQPIKTKYNKYRNLPWRDNPYEAEAINNELTLYKDCWKEVRKNFRIK